MATATRNEVAETIAEATAKAHRGYAVDDMSRTFDSYVRQGSDWKRYGGWSATVPHEDVCCLSAAVDFFHADEMQVLQSQPGGKITCCGSGYKG
jgi:hypothetical protein